MLSSHTLDMKVLHVCPSPITFRCTLYPQHCEAVR